MNMNSASIPQSYLSFTSKQASYTREHCGCSGRVCSAITFIIITLCICLLVCQGFCLHRDGRLYVSTLHLYHTL